MEYSIIQIVTFRIILSIPEDIVMDMNDVMLDRRDFNFAYLYYSFEGVKSHEDCPTHRVVVPCFLPHHKI